MNRNNHTILDNYFNTQYVLLVVYCVKYNKDQMRNHYITTLAQLKIHIKLAKLVKLAEFNIGFLLNYFLYKFCNIKSKCQIAK